MFSECNTLPSTQQGEILLAMETIIGASMEQDDENLPVLNGHIIRYSVIVESNVAALLSGLLASRNP